MLYFFRYKLKNKPILNLLYAILFGMLSLIFASIKFYIPGFEEITSNFREIPLLISILYISNPIYLLLLSLFTALYTPTGIPFLLNFLLHFASLFGFWILFLYIKKYFKSIVSKTIAWACITFFYYTLLIIPLSIVFGHFANYLPELSFVENYKSIYSYLRIEGITTVFVTTLYLIQFEIRETLIAHKNNLKKMVSSRTEELALTNKTLSNLNENLDDLVKERSKKIKEQLNSLIKYANMNSHEVRAPLARMLGLLYIIDKEEDGKSNNELQAKLKESAEELDEVVKKMNRLLEKEIFSKRTIR